MKIFVSARRATLWAIGLSFPLLGLDKAVAQTPPALVSESPANGAVNVPLNSTVVFTFSEMMQPAESIFWSGVDTNQFSYSWSADQTTLTCVYGESLPASSLVTWALNLSGQGFADLAGDPLPFTFGTFTTAGSVGGNTNGCNDPFSSGEYSQFSIAELAIYAQNSAAAPSPMGSNSFEFVANIKLATNLTASSATLTIPGQAAQPMLGIEPGLFFFTSSTNSFAKLSAAFPGGDYMFSISNETVTLNVPTGAALPNPPQLSGFAGAQTINAAGAFTLGWNVFNGGGTEDSIGVEVRDQSGALVFQSDSYGCPGSLNGTATSIVIPANTLSSNQTYQTEIVFVKVVTIDTNSQPPGPALLAAFETGTQTTIATGAGGVTPPPAALSLTNAAWLPGGNVRFDLTTTPGVTYTVEFNDNLGNSAGWAPLLTTNATATLVSITNRPPPGAQAGFYRASHN